MRASLDTNVIIHFYRAGLQNILFDFFDEGVFIYEQIRNIELENHGQDVLEKVDADIAAGKIELFTNQKLKDLAVYKIFENNVNENRNLYGAGDLGEVYAINRSSDLNWSFKSQVTKFIKRFFRDPYRDEDTKWIKKLASENNVNIKMKLAALSKLI